MTIPKILRQFGAAACGAGALAACGGPIYQRDTYPVVSNAAAPDAATPGKQIVCGEGSLDTVIQYGEVINDPYARLSGKSLNTYNIHVNSSYSYVRFSMEHTNADPAVRLTQYSSYEDGNFPVLNLRAHDGSVTIKNPGKQNDVINSSDRDLSKDEIDILKDAQDVATDAVGYAARQCAPGSRTAPRPGQTQPGSIDPAVDCGTYSATVRLRNGVTYQVFPQNANGYYADGTTVNVSGTLNSSVPRLVSHYDDLTYLSVNQEQDDGHFISKRYDFLRHIASLRPGHDEHIGLPWELGIYADDAVKAANMTKQACWRPARAIGDLIEGLKF